MPTEVLAAVATVVGVGAITPGPNNIAVMNAAARAGVMGALPAIAGIVFGSLGLLLLVVAGAGALLAAQPRWRTILTIGGSLYLCYLGARLIKGTPGAQADTRPREWAGRQRQAAGLFVFQFLNPKAWAIVLTATTAAGFTLRDVADLAWLSAIFAGVPFLCLVAWSAFGALFTRRLAAPRFRVRFDRAMGGLLAVS